MRAELASLARQLRLHTEARQARGEVVALFPKPAKAPEPSQAAPMLELARDAKACVRCPLSQTRKKVVFGEGNLKPRLVFVGEAPGAEEDREGRPFVGEAGQLLTRIIESIGLKREDVFICNVLKCRPPGNRNPTPPEIAACRGYLEQQLACLEPELICALGTFAAQTLLDSHEPIGRLRGKVFSYRGIPVIPTFHPAALLYHPQNKKLAWEDMKLVAKQLGLEIPAARKKNSRETP